MVQPAAKRGQVQPAAKRGQVQPAAFCICTRAPPASLSAVRFSQQRSAVRFSQRRSAVRFSRRRSAVRCGHIGHYPSSTNPHRKSINNASRPWTLSAGRVMIAIRRYLLVRHSMALQSLCDWGPRPRRRQHRVQRHRMVHTLSVVVPVGTQQKAGAARRRVARSATNLMSQPTCDTPAEDTDSVWPSATAWQ